MWLTRVVGLVCCCLVVTSGASNAFNRNYRSFGVVPAAAYGAPITYEGYETEADPEPQAPPVPAPAPAKRPPTHHAIRPSHTSTGGYASSRPAATPQAVYLRPAAPTHVLYVLPAHASPTLHGYGHPAAPNYSSAHQKPATPTYLAPPTIYRPAAPSHSPYSAPANPIQGYGYIREDASSHRHQHPSIYQHSHQHQATYATVNQNIHQQSTIPAPSCPQNYLFSCQPSLVPVPCSAGQTTAY